VELNIKLYVMCTFLGAMVEHEYGKELLKGNRFHQYLKMNRNYQAKLWFVLLFLSLVILHCNGVVVLYVVPIRSRLHLFLCQVIELFITKSHKQTPWPLVRKRTIPTERPPLVDGI
jgi:hypothetical protein